LKRAHQCPPSIEPLKQQLDAALASSYGSRNATTKRLLRHTGKPIDGQLQLLLDKKRCRPHAAPRLGLKLFCRRFEIDAFRSGVQLLDADIVSTRGPHIDGESRGASLWGAKHGRCAKPRPLIDQLGQPPILSSSSKGLSEAPSSCLSSSTRFWRMNSISFSRAGRRGPIDAA
jgi:hypothetical protein